MKFYQSIAGLYDEIFPPKPIQCTFVKKHLNKGAHTVLDVGCGTGNLTFQLAGIYKKVYGIDLDKEMLQLALRKRETRIHPEFREMNMLHLTKSFPDNYFDAVVCFGNTLVHLDSLDEISRFIMMAKEVLKPDSSLMIQTINYDRILKQKLRMLPTIETDEIEFIRNYNYLDSINRIEFETKLCHKASGDTVNNKINLYPLLKNEIDTILKNAGFKKIIYYGNFKMDSLSEESQPLIIVAS